MVGGGQVKKSFLMGFSQIVFTDISEIFRCKENIWTYFSLIGSLMAMFHVPAASTPTVALTPLKSALLYQAACEGKLMNMRNLGSYVTRPFNFLFSCIIAATCVCVCVGVHVGCQSLVGFSRPPKKGV